ncbi:MAG: transposase [Minisyncoccia bacterium]
MSSRIIPFPAELRPRLPTIIGNVDYLTLRQRLEQIESLLHDSGLERQFVEQALHDWRQRSRRTPSAQEQQKFQRRCRRALRCTLLRTLLQEDYRGFSCQLAGNPLYQWFCLIDAIDQIRVPSKSELQRFAHWLPAGQMRDLLNGLLRRALDQPRKLRLREPLDLEAYFLDTTALKANIHFPTDWVLLRDGVRTLMKATTLIRNQGLKGRMQPPQEFLRQINRLSMEMTHQRRTADCRRGRKRVLRQMKKLVKVVRAHARRRRQLLEAHWQQTEWTRPQTEQILRRLDNVLELLPRAQQQAHERIIGGRSVENREKILSLYEPDVHVIVRGKAGAEVEFGNTVLLGENRQGLIVDFAVYQQQAPADAHLLVESLERVQAGLDHTVGGVAADRGFASAINHQGLAAAGIFNGICPRQPQQLKELMKEQQFVNLQRRRSQTEARIGILKNGFFGRPMRAKGFAHRELAVAWGVLTHNLWMLARLRKTKKKPQPLLQAA